MSFQIDKVTGDSEKIEFGASANLGPVGIGLGYWDNANDEKTFTGVAISAGAAGVNLTIGLGSTDYVDTENGKGEAEHKHPTCRWFPWRFWSFLCRSSD